MGGRTLERHADTQTHKTLRTGSEASPLVATAFINLPRQEAKHPYSLERTVLVPADYVAFCSNITLETRHRRLSPCAVIQNSRARARGKWKAGVSTEVRPTGIAQLLQRLSDNARLPAASIRAAAQRSVDPLHCPSAEIIMIWLAKPFLVWDVITAHPDHHGLFAWVDAGFNVYQMRPFGPPPPPWRTFFPRQGRLAVAREPGACHNELHGANRSRCIIATFLYGSRAAWAAFLPIYTRRLRNLVHLDEGAPKPLCTEQDLYEDVAAIAPDLFDEFDVSDSWGWVNARPHDPTKSTRGGRGDG